MNPEERFPEPVTTSAAFLDRLRYRKDHEDQPGRPSFTKLQVSFPYLKTTSVLLDVRTPMSPLGTRQPVQAYPTPDWDLYLVRSIPHDPVMSAFFAVNDQSLDQSTTQVMNRCVN